MEQAIACINNDTSDPINPLLGLCPVARVIDNIADSWEICFVVPGPQLRSEEDVFELCAVGDLYLLETVLSYEGIFGL